MGKISQNTDLVNAGALFTAMRAEDAQTARLRSRKDCRALRAVLQNFYITVGEIRRNFMNFPLEGPVGEVQDK